MINHLIVGPGAIGSRLAPELTGSFAHISFCDRSGPLAHRYEYVVAGQGHIQDFSLQQSMQTFDFVHICVKAMQVASAMRQLEQVSAQAFLIYANGYYECDDIPDLNKAAKVVTNVAAKWTDNRCVRTDLNGQVYIPEFEIQRNKQLEILITHYPHLYLKVDNAYRAMKWVLNCSLNTICAAKFLARNGEVIPQYLPLLEDCFNEALILAAKLFPDQSLDSTLTYKWLMETIHSTQDNKNSMVVDLELGRKTEVDYLSGLATESSPNLYKLTQEIKRNTRGAG